MLGTMPEYSRRSDAVPAAHVRPPQEGGVNYTICGAPRLGGGTTKKIPSRDESGGDLNNAENTEHEGRCEARVNETIRNSSDVPVFTAMLGSASLSV